MESPTQRKIQGPPQAPPTPPPTSPPSQPAKAPGTVLLGKYQLGRRLGSGSFAKVHVARSIGDDELFAVKIIDKKKTVNASMEPRIIREIDAMRRLHHHPNILKIHEVMATKYKIYLVMELAAGGDLFSKVLHRGRLPETAARRYFQQLASALRFCHQNGVAHRDVKPQNLLLDREGNLKVSDFGLSALPEHLRHDGLLHTACGTPAYTAPEIVARRGYVTPESRIPYDGAQANAWSCGVILFVLLAGFVPFDDSNIVAMYRKIHRRDYRFPNWISKQARSIIYHMLDPNPDTRMSIETVMRTSWFKKSLETSDFHGSIFQSDPFLQKEAKSTIDSITAFDIISLSSELDLSGLFERRRRREKRFTARVSVDRAVEKVKEIGEKLGFVVEKKKGGLAAAAVGLGKGRTAVVVEAVEIAPEVVVAEMKVAVGDDDEETRWSELDEIVLSWHSDVV
ncbi:PREDICTED: CBL-interacting serine/threonine-protein kinase 7-like [Tarenaya hassleriana]|uniref:CBL-interacting serine/threonine-protein kinase 7-like n=1 Tax=Tarenaya hassleriana TaxID=28532 RepID=UPI00053C217D|nr:PREDICTED: CBL-interacting serine/threonine-protein kinase 7-like [Tarenaya hassleriana]